MASLEERLSNAQHALEQAERRTDQYLKGVPDFEAYRIVLEEDAVNLLQLVRRLNVEEFPGNMDLLDSIQLTVNNSKKIIEAIDGLSPTIQPLLDEIKNTLDTLDLKFTAEMTRQAELRELEKKTLDNINAYLEKFS